MKKYMMVLALIGSCATVFSQYRVTRCISGDCNNGIGVAELDNYRKYRGTFRDSLPEGTGIMLNTSYNEEAPEYVGEFKQGFMHGKGTFLYKKNAEYAEADFANGHIIKGTIFFETGKRAVITSVKASKTGDLFTGKMIGAENKESTFSGIDFSGLQEMAYNTGNIARNPKLMEELSADLKVLTGMFEAKFAKADKLMSLYSELLLCLPDDMGCAGNKLSSIETESQFFNYNESIDLDARVKRIENNFFDYRTRPGTTAQQKNESVQLVKLIGNMLSRHITGQVTSMIEGVKNAVLASGNQYGKGDVSVMKANFPFQRAAAKDSRDKDWELWKILTRNFNVQ